MKKIGSVRKWEYVLYWHSLLVNRVKALTRKHTKKAKQQELAEPQTTAPVEEVLLWLALR